MRSSVAPPDQKPACPAELSSSQAGAAGPGSGPVVVGGGAKPGPARTLCGGSRGRCPRSPSPGRLCPARERPQKLNSGSSSSQTAGLRGRPHPLASRPSRTSGPHALLFWENQSLPGRLEGGWLQSAARGRLGPEGRGRPSTRPHTHSPAPPPAREWPFLGQAPLWAWGCGGVAAGLQDAGGWVCSAHTPWDPGTGPRQAHRAVPPRRGLLGPCARGTTWGQSPADGRGGALSGL